MSERARSQISILNTSIDNLTQEEILERVKNFFDEPKFHQIATVNPEFLLEAEKNTEFRDVLRNCNLRIADGFGIVLAGLLQGKCITRFPGADLLEELLKLANEKKLEVYLAVRKNGLSTYDEVRGTILKRFPDIKISGENIDPNQAYSIRDTKYDILFCNFGAPQQEIFLNNLKNQNNIRLALGVGGSFDYLTGKQKRAPRWLQSIGFEWFWRLLLQPKRFGRIWNAVVIFPFHVFFATMKFTP